MFKRISIALGTLTLLAMSVAVWAPEASAHGDGERDRVRWGEWWLVPGVFEAEGDGIAAGAGKLNLKLCAEDGLLLVKKGDSEIAVDAYEDSIEWLGLHVYFGFHGCAQISGWGVAALVVGDGLTMRAEGIGIAYLAGEGTWAKAGGDSGEWLAEGKIYKIGMKIGLTPTPVATEEPDATETPHSTEEPEATPTPGEGQ